MAERAFCWYTQPVLEEDVQHTPSGAFVPWEQPGIPFVRRALGTLAGAFAPTESGPAIVSERVLTPALGFALLFALPLMAAWAIIPFTHTLEFRAGAELLVRAGADQAKITLDVLRAAGIGVIVSLISLASWAVPYASLLRAFCPEPELAAHAPRYAARLALYRAFLVPAAMALFYVSTWLIPEAPAILVFLLVQLLRFVPRLIVFMHTVALARALGLSAGARLAVVLVPVGVESATALFVEQAMAALLPDMTAH